MILWVVFYVVQLVFIWICGIYYFVIDSVVWSLFYFALSFGVYVLRVALNGIVKKHMFDKD